MNVALHNLKALVLNKIKERELQIDNLMNELAMARAAKNELVDLRTKCEQEEKDEADRFARRVVGTDGRKLEQET